MTTEEFLAWEDAQELRHAFVDGEIFAMTGALLPHGSIALNLSVILATQLRGRCRVFSQGTKVRAKDDIFYPDIVVACRQAAKNQRYLVDATLIAEVLSLSTRRYDRETKWVRYRDGLPGLQAYLMFEQHEPRAWLFRRGPEGWRETVHEGLDAVIELADPGCRLDFAEVYLDVEFAEPEPDDPA